MSKVRQELHDYLYQEHNVIALESELDEIRYIVSKDSEIIICAALRTPSGQIIYGHRHHDCLRTWAAMYEVGREHGKYTDDDKIATQRNQGFVTSKNRFVDRVEALQIALQAGQVLDKSRIRANRLFSEDLY